MSFQLKQHEQEVWDGFARAALNGVIANKSIGSTLAAELAGKFADDMILERRKREKEKTGFLS